MVVCGEVEREGGGFETEEDLIEGRKVVEDLKRFDDVESLDWCLMKLRLGEGIERVEEEAMVSW